MEASARRSSSRCSHARQVREVGGVGAQHLDFEVRLEAEHDLAHVGADRLGIQRKDTVAERATTETRVGVGRVVVGDRFETEATARSQPPEAPGEEPTIREDPFRSGAAVAREVLERPVRDDRVVRFLAPMLGPALETDLRARHGMCDEIVVLRSTERESDARHPGADTGESAQIAPPSTTDVENPDRSLRHDCVGEEVDLGHHRVLE